MTMLAWLVESSVRLTVLVGIVAAALWALRVTAAETRLRVWTAVIAAAFLLPLLPDQWVVPVSLGFSEPTATSTLIGEPSAAWAANGATGVGPLSRLDAVTVLIALYIAGVVALLVRLGAGWSWTRRLTNDATEVAGHDFFESSLVHVPVTVGLVRPRIVLPDTWREWPEDMLAAVLAHEGAHAARRDGLWLTMALLHRALQWVNPLAWWLPRHMASLSERASDDAALMRGVAPTRYAEILLSFATAVAAGQRRVAWIVAMARPAGGDTERRLDRVLTWKGRAEMNRSRLVVLALVLLSGSAAVYTAGTAPVSVSEAVTITQAPATKTSPVIIRRVEPEYTPDARRAGIQGIVEIEVVIDATGVVSEARILKSLDTKHGLDSEALSSARQWLFRPATVDGKAVPFTATVQMEFRQLQTPRAGPNPAPKPQPKPDEAVEQKTSPVVVAPVATKRVDPKYTPEAMRAKIQGIVTLLVSIDANGVVTGATVAESLDAEHGLDTNAIAAVMQWSFRPGTIDGVAKAFDVKISMEFRLH